LNLGLDIKKSSIFRPWLMVCSLWRRKIDLTFCEIVKRTLHLWNLNIFEIFIYEILTISQNVRSILRFWIV